MINYKHLNYLREVALAGSLARASDRLHLTPQTISAQLSLLDEAFGVELFRRQGRRLELTEAGEVALEYANEIFQLGDELEKTFQNFSTKGKTRVFRVGVSDLVPKAIAYQLLQPAMALKGLRIVCMEGKLADLLGELAVQRMELVLADSPMPANLNVKGFNHELGSSSVSFFATPELQQTLVTAFPACLNNAPLLLPSEGAAVRKQLMQWFTKQGVRPVITGEFDDSALLQAFGQAGSGIFIAPTVLQAQLEAEGKARVLGHAPKIKEHYFAISIERRITHPAVKAITEHAQGWLN
ncbi:transcriptional activator NhaR [Thiolinea disciformis]|uniref:transcriptional activator NhaR n=1 Tax=Thiolinea disciformis TaxID=125614 RepID=UPI000362D21D|nr:transcriptional activator NhaR [Thiolinea disciformis]